MSIWKIIKSATKDTAHEAVTDDKWFYISGLIAFALTLVVGWGYGFLVAGLWLGYWFAKGKWR